MAFLFKSKKNADRAHAAKENGVAGSQASIQTASSNGRGLKEKNDVDVSGAVKMTTPGSSVNNSMNSLGGTVTPSPEQTARRAPSSEQQPSDLPVSLNCVQLFGDVVFCQ